MRFSTFVRRGGLALAGLSAAAALSACGGSDDGTPPPQTQTQTNMPPASASADPLGFIAYLKILTATNQDTVEPLDLTGFVAPTDDVGPYDTTI